MELQVYLGAKKFFLKLSLLILRTELQRKGETDRGSSIDQTEASSQEHIWVSPIGAEAQELGLSSHCFSQVYKKELDHKWSSRN